VLEAIRHLTLQGLRAADATSRARALHLVRARPLNNENKLLHLVLPLLRDPAAQVRREAICAIGLKPDVINSEDLLAWLHDPDKEVRRWCEKALRSPQRHLSELELELGRLITDNRAKERLKAFRYLGRDANLEPGVWIRRLSYDPEDAVRIAAARAAAEHGVVHLADRLREMSRSDRSPTVRQEATYYQTTLQPRQ
jgi:HEAT repeat protein